MRWQEGRRSSNVEDRRGAGPARGGGGRGVRVGGGGLVGILVLAGVVWALGGDPSSVLRMATSGGASGPAPSGAPLAPGADPQADFVSVVLADTEDTWGMLFPQQLQRAYVPPRLVLFRDVVDSACGEATSAVGPFYCPGDRQVYIDLSFFRDLDARFGAPGDFAQAYVIGHEVGHHIQNLLGTNAEVHRQQRGLPEAAANALNVKMELQADCYAGVWAHHAHRQRQILEAGDVEEALGAAAAIGDDRLQQRAGGRVVPESFTHGTSAERAQWLRAGMTTGQIAACNTF